MTKQTNQFSVGDPVAVLRACRLPKIEEVIGYGVIESITPKTGLYFVSGFPMARSADVLRYAMFWLTRETEMPYGVVLKSRIEGTFRHDDATQMQDAMNTKINASEKDRIVVRVGAAL